MSDQTVAGLLRAATQQLTAANVPGAARDARLLLGHILGVAPARLSLMAPDVVSEARAALFMGLVTRRTNREPVSHLIGHREFYGRLFSVGPAVLDPRPETECLIEAALALNWHRALDLGTGSGAILLTLLAERKAATGVGVDISPDALAVVQRNAIALGVMDRADLEIGDWGAQITEKFDLVTCNPPYISLAEYQTLEPEPKRWEPRIALTPEGDGLDAYRIVTKQLSGILAPGGTVLYEIGPTQANAVCTLLTEAGLSAPKVLPDLDGRDRVIAARMPG